MLMALASTAWMGLAGYMMFGLGAGVFLALHTAQTLRILPKPSRRGRDLGIFNLTNTVPSLILPWLTLALVPTMGFAALFAVLSLLCFGSTMILLLSFARANAILKPCVREQAVYHCLRTFSKTAWDE